MCIRDSTHSVPSFLKKSGELVKELKQKEPSEIASLMGLSDKLASLNFDRYQSWKAEKKISDNSKPALLVFKGDVYQGDTKMIPENLGEAKLALAQSEMLKSAFGEDVVKHYCRAAEVELEEYDRVVTDWEIARGFERA